MVNIMKNKIKYLPIGILTLTTAVSGAALSSARVAADGENEKASPVSVTVSTACFFTSEASPSTSLSIYPGNTSNTESSDKGNISISCNNPNGFSVKAVGYGPDAQHSEGVEGNTSLYDSLNGNTIATGNSGTDSYWSFKAKMIHSSTSGSTIVPAYTTYTSVPSEPTEIATFAGTTSSSMVGIFRTDYQVYASPTQPSGSYKGAVKYTIVPSGSGS